MATLSQKGPIEPARITLIVVEVEYKACLTRLQSEQSQPFRGGGSRTAFNFVAVFDLVQNEMGNKPGGKKSTKKSPTTSTTPGPTMDGAAPTDVPANSSDDSSPIQDDIDLDTLSRLQTEESAETAAVLAQFDSEQMTSVSASRRCVFDF